MYTHADKTQENKSQSLANGTSQKQSGSESTFQFVDNRPVAIAQRKLQEMTINSPQAKQATQLQAMADNYTSQQQQPIQKKENNTGLPDNLKAGIETLSGYAMDDVKVHRNSDKPAQLQAHAYAQGTDIHLGSGQEKHLPHEAWHVVQQKQGRVKPTMQMKGKVNVNDDTGLEKEADVMGAKAVQMKPSDVLPPIQRNSWQSGTGNQTVIQGLFLTEANRDIEEDNSTLKVEWHLARDEKRDTDKAIIAAKQQELATKVRHEADVEDMRLLLSLDEEKHVNAKYALKVAEAGADVGMAILFMKSYTSGANPALPFDVMLTLREAGVLVINACVYRDFSYGANGMKYFLAIRKLPFLRIGEWHVHWNTGKKAGKPGWKKGENGTKTETGDEMKKILGDDLWGIVKNSGAGNYV